MDPVRFLVAATLTAVLGCNTQRAPVEDSGVATDTLRVDVVVGALYSDGPEAFGEVSGIAADRSGRIYVADAQSHTVEVFARSGEHLVSIGDEGEGPGELRSPCCIGWSPDGHLWVRDRGNVRYSLFAFGDAGGEFVDVVPMSHADPDRPSPTTFRDGLLADIGDLTDDEGRRRPSRHWIDRTGRVQAVEEFESISPEELGGRSVSRLDGAATFLLYPPQGPRDLLGFGPDGLVVHGVSSTYDLRLEGRDGDVRIFRPGAEGAPLSQAEVQGAQARLDQLAARIGGTVSDLPFGIPDLKPPIADAYFAQNGDLWVERSVAQGTQRQADVWSAQGERLRHVVWPAEVVLSVNSWIGDGVVIGLRKDEFGVDYVVVLRPQPPA